MNKRLRKEIKKLLHGKELSTTEVHDILNDRFTHGPTMNQTGNLLARTKGIEKCGFIDTTVNVMDSKGVIHMMNNRCSPLDRTYKDLGRVRVTLWRLKD